MRGVDDRLALGIAVRRRQSSKGRTINRRVVDREIGVDRLIVNLSGQWPERADRRMAEIETLVKLAA
jgi:hypothetical protein